MLPRLERDESDPEPRRRALPAEQTELALLLAIILPSIHSTLVSTAGGFDADNGVEVPLTLGDADMASESREVLALLFGVLASTTMLVGMPCISLG